MKDGILSLLEKGKSSRNRAALAVAVGVLAMLLILLSEIFPQTEQNAPAGQEENTLAYQTQLEQRLEKLISQMNGAGKTTVMVWKQERKPFMHWTLSPVICRARTPMSFWTTARR